MGARTRKGEREEREKEEEEEERGCVFSGVGWWHAKKRWKRKTGSLTYSQTSRLLHFLEEEKMAPKKKTKGGHGKN